ncbi:MAG: kelch repeat-containing protein [Planctomycetota bacterium]
MPTGNIYALQGSAWTLVMAGTLPTSRPLAFALDNARQQVLALESSTGASWQDPRSNTWLFSGGQWAFTHDGPPLDRYFAAMVYDSQRHRMVLHGGFHGIFTLYDTYELEDTAWHLGSTGTNTSALNRAYLGMAYDATRGRTVMIGGTSIQNPVAEWNGSAWSFPSATYAPAGRQSPGFVFDRARHRCVLFGGQGIGEFADTWAWNGTAWVDLTTAGPAPTPRHAVGMAYDSDRDRVVLFGGTDGTTRFGDTWEFDGSTWLARPSAAAPTPRFGHVQGYDPDRQRTFVFGGDDGGDPRDLWEWDGVVWTPRTLPHVPDTGIGVCGAYDESRREIVLFGGQPAHGETWRLRDTSLGAWSSTGQGCDTGNGSLTLSTQDALALGRTSNLDVTHLPAHLAVLASVWIGFDDTQWNGLSLPFSLAAIGRPSCQVWAEPVIAIWLANLGTGSGQATVAIPSDPGFLGLRLFAQAVSFELGVARFSTANLLAANIGPH